MGPYPMVSVSVSVQYEHLYITLMYPLKSVLKVESGFGQCEHNITEQLHCKVLGIRIDVGVAFGQCE